MLDRGTNPTGTTTDERDRDRPPTTRARPSEGSSPAVSELAQEARSKHIGPTAAAMFVAGASVAVAVATLIVQNTEPTTVEWAAWDPTAPMWIVLVLTFVAGIAAAPLLAGGYALMRTRRRHREEHIDDLARRTRA